MDYNPILCDQKHKRQDEINQTHERRLNNHAGRIDILEQGRASSDTKIDNLCDQIKSLVATIRWSGGLLVSVLVGFFIWYIQNL